MKWLLCISLIFVAVRLAHAQLPLSTKNKKAIELYNQADNYRVRGQYVEALQALQEAIGRDSKFFEAYFRMGLVYRAQRQNEMAVDQLERGLAMVRDMRWSKAFSFELADLYLRLGNYERSLKHANFFLANETISKPKIAQALLWKKSDEFSLANKRTIDFVQGPLTDTVNRFHMQYFPVLTADEQQIIFTRRTGYRDENDEDLVIATRENGRWTPPVSLSTRINSPYNEGTCTISADGRQLIFTSCQGRRVFGSCDLFESRKVGSEWTDPVNMGAQINSPAWESQPSLSADGRILYFVSDRRGGVGGRDIYVAFKLDENKWSKAQNLGKIVNTPFNEISPFIHVNGRSLFFATDGRPGFGGYDIFRSEWADSTWTEPVNFGYPINNHEDQFSLFITANGERGYYSHEENDPLSRSKIFEFHVPAEYKLKVASNVVKGIVRDKVTKAPVKAQIELYNLATNEVVSEVNSDSLLGSYLMVLTQGADYALYVNSPGYLFQNLHFNFEASLEPTSIIIDVDLEPAKAGASVVLNNIFFDVDKFDLKPRSVTELEKVVQFLQQNPSLQVEISGHTDNTGAEAYNQTLSLKRAEAVQGYLISKGISVPRIVCKGYGSRQPLRPNDTDQNRQMNRRIEFRLLK